ncbi:MAG: bifunctional 4-hydroxy-2-oxoglutarate aldolase/2-dehydro-3-deoxy-phosphogluconate aldolase, partial [Marinirhabdus sp.]
RGDFAFQVFGALVTESTARYPDMILGVGSVTDAASASLYMQLGANFVVAPVFRKDIAKVCNRRKVPFFPGCGSLTEIAKAEEYGCDIVKLFPAEHYGPKFIKAVKGPQPWTRIMPTGGVLPTQESIGPWLKAGATCLGMGSKLLVKTESGSYDFTKIEQLVSASLKIISECKKPGQ